jgi:hypothetical protein
MRKLILRQKNCWLFKQNVMNSMESSRALLVVAKVYVDETYVGANRMTRLRAVIKGARRL